MALLSSPLCHTSSDTSYGQVTKTTIQKGGGGNTAISQLIVDADPTDKSYAVASMDSSTLHLAITWRGPSNSSITMNDYTAPILANLCRLDSLSLRKIVFILYRVGSYSVILALLPAAI
mmetsp:Transcript_1404/g.1495  ORF Transcript_1404/g.1495 Transcript_1404/m.1495 type:complete len:119 (-) Transcript_1404:105-461(-)